MNIRYVLSRMVVALFGAISALCVAQADDYLYASGWLGPGWGPCGIVRVDKTTGIQTVITQGGYLADLFVILPESPTTLLAVTPSWGNAGILIRVDVTTGTQSVVAGGLGQATGALMLPDGNVLVADDGWSGPGGIKKVNPQSGTVTQFSTGGRPSKLILHTDGYVYFTGWNINGQSGVARLDLATGAWTPVSSGGMFIYAGYLVEDLNGDLLVADSGSQNDISPSIIFRVDRATGAQTLFSNGAGSLNLSSLFIDDSGTIFAGDYGPGNDQTLGAIYRVDRATGALSLVSFGQYMRVVQSITGFKGTADVVPPMITSLTATPSTLWPANHKMVNVVLSATVIDAVDPLPITGIVSVSCNQPVNGSGDGNTSSDWQITGPMTLKLRAERSGNSTDRIYTITVESRDHSGNASTRTVTVTVPHDQGKK